jgi:hypothetical protein
MPKDTATSSFADYQAEGGRIHESNKEEVKHELF